MEGITRYAGKKHFTSTQHRSIFKEIIGPDSYILEANEKLEPELQSNNLLRIRSGMLCHHGFISEIKKNTYDEVTINNGTQGMKRIDLVVLRHTRNAETEVENCEWVVIRGTPAASGATAPEYTNGDINNGDLVDDCPVFKVELEGIQVVSVTKLLNVLGGTLAEQTEAITELNGNMGGLRYKMYEISERNWTKGANTALVLDIDASKIRVINALIYNSSVSFLLPLSPFNEVGEYNANFGANIRLIMQTKQLILHCGGNWSGYALHVTVGYVE